MRTVFLYVMIMSDFTDPSRLIIMHLTMSQNIGC